MKVAFKAIDSRGGIVSDILEAGTVLEAVEKLRSDGLFVTDVQESSGRIKKVRGGETTLPSDEGHFTLGELMYFTRQMSMLLGQEVPSYRR